MQKKKTPQIYDSLRTINRRFVQILLELDALEQFDWFRDRVPIQSAVQTVRETHARTMFEILEVLHEHEEQEWTRLGRIRGAAEEPPRLGR